MGAFVAPPLATSVTSIVHLCPPEIGLSLIYFYWSGFVRRVFQVYMEAARIGPNNPVFPSDLVIRDPHYIKDEVYIHDHDLFMVADEVFIPHYTLLHCHFFMFSVGQVNFKKQQAGLVDVEFRAWDLELSGLHHLQIENLHVVRHVGLRDIR